MWENNLKIYYPLFSVKQKKAADILLGNPHKAGEITIRECSALSGTGQSTILRMLQCAGYESWSAFQHEVWKDLGHRTMTQDVLASQKKEKFRRYESIFHVIQDDITMISDMAENLDIDKIEEVVKVIKKAKIIDVYGTDNSANAAAELSGRLLHLGLTSRNYSDLFFQKISAGHLRKKDIAIGFSISGKTKAVVEALMSARNAGAVTVAVTGDETSELAIGADYIFKTPTIYFSEVSKWIASRISQMAFVDALCVAIMESDRERFSLMLSKSAKEFEEDLLDKQ